MKALNYLFIPLTALLLAGSWACSSNTQDASSGHAVASGEVTNLEMCMDLLNAEKFYGAPGFDNDSIYVVLKASIQWPSKVGKSNLGTLQDSILFFAFGPNAGKEPAKAMDHYVNDTTTFSTFLVENAIYAPVTQIPAGTTSWDQVVTGKLQEVNDRYVTYQVQQQYYTGGAHGSTVTHPFTYDLSTGVVIDFNYLFKPGSMPAIIKAIKQGVATDRNIYDPAMLEDAGITISDDYPGLPYVSDNLLMFHFDAYEIASYAEGAFEIPVIPYEVEQYLTPAARALLDMD